MTINVSWDNEQQTIILWDYSSQWDIEEYLDALESTIDMMKSVSHHVDIIAIVPSYWVPRGILHHVRKTFQLYPRDTIVVTVSAHYIVSELMKTVQRLFPAFAPNLIMARSLEDARQVVNNYQKKKINLM